MPYWEKRFQRADSVQRNFIITECDQLYSAIDKAKHGIDLFGLLLEQGLQVSEVNALEKRVKVMLQRTHPDKVNGLEEQFKQMNKAKTLIKSGIPLPDTKVVSTSTPRTAQLSG